MGLVTELIGGPLDGLEVEIVDPLDRPVSGRGIPPGLDSILMDWFIPSTEGRVRSAIYRVYEYRGKDRLVFDGYADE